VIRASFGKSVARSTLIGGLALLAVPAVAGCEAGLNAPTLEFHPAAGGAYATFDGISVSNAFVLAAPAGSSVPAGGSASLFVGLFNNGSTNDKLLSVSAPNAAASVTIKGGGVTTPSSSGSAKPSSSGSAKPSASAKATPAVSPSATPSPTASK
jgi:hypothetical protein